MCAYVRMHCSTSHKSYKLAKGSFFLNFILCVFMNAHVCHTCSRYSVQKISGSSHQRCEPPDMGVRNLT